MSIEVAVNDFEQIVSGRRSIRQYDPSVVISKEEMTEILRKSTLAPSSVNMQPWHFLVIQSPEGKEKLAELASFNKKQVETSSAVVAVFADLNSADNLEAIYSRAVELGMMPEEVKAKQIAWISQHYSTASKELLRDTALIDSGLVSMQLMLVARAHGYDTNPIGGFDKEHIAEVFGLDAQRYLPVMLISMGKAAESGYASVRLPVEKIADWK